MPMGFAAKPRRLKIGALGNMGGGLEDSPINGLDNGDERGYRTKGNGRSTAEKVRQYER
jgi:hypothetical protein